MPDPIQDNDKVKALYDGVSKDYNIGTYDEFKTKLQDPSKRKSFYEGVGKEYQLGTFEEFESKIVPRIPQPTSIKTEFDEVRKQKQKIQSLDNTIAGTEEKINVSFVMSANDDVLDLKNVQAEKQKEEQNLKGTVSKIASKIGVNEAEAKSMVEDLVDTPEEVFKQQGSTEDEILLKYKEDPVNTKQQLAAYKWLLPLQDIIKQKNPDGYRSEQSKILALQGVNPETGEPLNFDFDQVRRSDLEKRNMILAYTEGDEDDSLRKKMLSNLAKDAALNYSGLIRGTENELSQVQIQGLDNDQKRAYLFYETLSPEEAERYKQLNVDPNKLTSSEKLGYQRLGKELKVKGIELTLNGLLSTINRLEVKYKKDGLSEQEAAIYKSYIERYEAESKKINDINRIENPNYQDINVHEAFLAEQDLGEQRSTGIDRFLKKVGVSVDELVSGTKNLIASPFRSTEGNYMAQLDAMGESMFNEEIVHVKPENSLEQSYEYVLSKDFKNSLDAINNDKNLTPQEKRFARVDLINNNAEGFYKKSIDPKMNFSGNAIGNAFGDMIAALLPLIATEGLGTAVGLSKAPATFAAVTATAFQPNYVQAIEEGVKNPYITGLVRTGVQAAFFAGVDGIGAIRKLYSPKTAIGSALSKMSDKEIQAIISKVPQSAKTVFSKFKEAAGVSNKLALATTGAELTNAAIEGKLSDLDIVDMGKHAMIEWAKNTLLFGVTGSAKSLYTKEYKVKSDLDKLALFNAAARPKEFIAEVDKAILDGTVSESQGQQMKDNATKANAVFESLEFIDGKGNFLSEKAARELLFNKVKEMGVKEFLAKEVPPSLKEKSEIELETIKAENNLIYEPKTEKQLESTKNKLEKQLEEKDDNGKPTLNEKQQIAIKGELQAVKNKLAEYESSKQTTETTTKSVKQELPKEESGTIAEPTKVSETESKEQLVEKAKSLSDNVQGLYKDVFKENVEESLFEAAIQANSSAGEKKGAIATFGKEIVDIAQQLYPNAKVGDSFKETVKVEQPTVQENAALRDVESTVKALEGKDISTKISTTLKEINHFSDNENFEFDKNKGAWFTTDKSGYVRRPNAKTKISRYIDEKSLNLATEKQAFLAGDGNFEKGLKELEKQGYDGVKTKNNNSTEYYIFDVNKTKNRQELISEAYHADKAAGKETELVKAVESLLSKEQTTKTEPTVQETKTTVEEAKPIEVDKETDLIIEPPKGGDKETQSEEAPELRNKAILERVANSKNINEATKEKLKDNLKYKVSSKEEAKSVAQEVIKEYGHKDAVTLAEAGKFNGDVNSFIFSEAIDNAFNKEQSAKTPEEKVAAAEEWADLAMRYDETARDKGRFISAIYDFYKKSPLGIQMVEKAKRSEEFAKWFKNKEKSFKEVYEEIIKEPEFQTIIKEEVQKELKKERVEARKAKREKIEDFFDKAKFKGDATYSTIIPAPVVNGALEIMKQTFLAGESVVNAVDVAVRHISEKIGDNWDKEKFKNEYEKKLSAFESTKGNKTKEELTIEKKERLLEKFRDKLKGLSEKDKDEVIRKSFKKLVESGALEYNDFKKIIADTVGLGEFTPQQVSKITELVNDINKVSELGEKARETKKLEDLKNYQDAKKQAEKAATQLGELVYNQPNVWNRVLGIMQLNTLGIPSLVNNPIFNIWNQLTVRLPIGIQLTALDQVLYGASKVTNKLFGTGVLLPENNIITGQKEFWNKLGLGTKESAEQLLNGMTNADYFQKEVKSSQIHPVTSLKDLWKFAMGEKRLTKAQIIDKVLQGTVGIPAEIVARVLNIGDKPQRFAAEGSQAAVFAKNLGLKGIDYLLFMEFPKEEAYRAYKQKGFSDEVAMKKAEEIKERIIKQGEESVFQQDNLLNDAINKVFEPFGKAGEVFKKFNMPFVKIPLNAFWSVYNLVNPELAILQSAVYGYRYAKTKSPLDLQQSKKWLAHATTGMALMGIAGGLAKMNIINADNDDSTTKKERQGETAFEQQKSINITKLNALLQGKDPDKVENGLNIDLKWLGNVGNVLNAQASKIENMTPEQRKNGLSYWEDIKANATASTTDFIDNGIFSNSGALLTAATKGGQFMDSYLINLMNMGTNIIQPAMTAQISRARLPYYSKVKADSFYDEVKNNFLTRSDLLRALTDKYPPAKIGLWGDVMEKKDNTMMRLFGISSSTKDNFAQPIYEDYKRTKNTKFFPPSVMPRINNEKLTVAEAEKLEILVGKARKNLILPFINDGAILDGYGKRYSELDDDEKTDALEIIYNQGFENGKAEFISLYPKYAKQQKSEKKTEQQSMSRSFRASVKDTENEY
jgi:hypothetical protein